MLGRNLAKQKDRSTLVTIEPGQMYLSTHRTGEQLTDLSYDKYDDTHKPRNIKQH